jgi:hypothetical protein
MKLKVLLMNYDAVAGNALDEPVRTSPLVVGCCCTSIYIVQQDHASKVKFISSTFIFKGVRARIW